jgi:RNA polymerase sigma-70 factor (ECF subfamily)
MYDSAYQRIGNREEVEELLQDLFLSIWAKKETLDIHTNLEAYLMGALKFKIYNHFRAQKVKDAYISAYTYLGDAAQNVVEDVIYYDELYLAIEKSVGLLPDKCREVYILSRHEHLSYREISTRLNMPIDTVEKQMSKALKFLRQHLKDFMLLLLWVCIH